MPSSLGNQRGGRAGAEGEGGCSVETAVHGLENLSGRRLSSERGGASGGFCDPVCDGRRGVLRTEGRKGVQKQGLQ